MIITAQIELRGWEETAPESLIAADIARQIIRDAGEDILAEARDIAREEIQSRISKIVEEALATPIQRTDQFGEPQGGPRSLRAMILAETQLWLHEKVRKDSGAPGGGYTPLSRMCPRIEYLLGSSAREVLEPIYKDQIKEEVTAIKAELDGQVAEWVAAALKAKIGLK